MTKLEQLILGLQTIHRINPKAGFEFQHDVLYVRPSLELSEADAKILEDCGFRYVPEIESWAWLS